MKWSEVRKLAKQIRQQGYRCHVRGWEGSYDIVVTDCRTYKIIIKLPEQWAEQERLGQRLGERYSKQEQEQEQEQRKESIMNVRKTKRLERLTGR